jgi:hypothetical protein
MTATARTLGSASSDPSPAPLGNPRDGQTAYRSGKSARELADEEYTELLASDSVEITDPDNPGYAGGSAKGATVIPAQAGDLFRFGAVVTTEGGIWAQLIMMPTKMGDSTGSRPDRPKKDLSGIRYGTGAFSPWKRGTQMPMSIKYRIPDDPEWDVINIHAGIYTPNPPEYANKDWPQDQRTGTISWEQATIERIPPSQQKPEQSPAVSASTGLIAVATAGAGYYAYQNLL